MFKEDFPIVNFYTEPDIAVIEKLEQTFEMFINYKQFRIIIDFKTVKKIPARLGGTIVKLNSMMERHNGKVVISAKDEGLFRQLKNDSFIDKIGVFSELDNAFEKIKTF